MQLMMHYSCPWKAGGKLNFIQINALAHVLTFSIVHGNDQKSNLSNNGEEHFKYTGAQ